MSRRSARLYSDVAKTAAVAAAAPKRKADGKATDDIKAPKLFRTAVAATAAGGAKESDTAAKPASGAAASSDAKSDSTSSSWEARWMGVRSYAEFRDLTIKALGKGSGLRTPSAALCAGSKHVLCRSCNRKRADLIAVNAADFVTVEYWPAATWVARMDKKTLKKKLCKHKGGSETCVHCDSKEPTYDVGVQVECKEWIVGFVSKDKWPDLEQLCQAGYTTVDLSDSAAKEEFHNNCRRWETLEQKQLCVEGDCFCQSEGNRLLAAYKKHLNATFYDALMKDYLFVGIFHGKYNQSGVLDNISATLRFA